jgi:hypothetical protein
MTCRRYGRLSDCLYRFVSSLALAQPNAGWCEREEIEMALRFIRRLEHLHEKEEWEEREWRRSERALRLNKKKAGVVKLVTGRNGNEGA